MDDPDISGEWKDERIQEEVKKGRLLIILDDHVYDCTKFSAIHPGGRNYIEQYAGMQVRGVMSDGPHEHSFNAYQLMNDYCCGTFNKTKASRHLTQQQKNIEETSSKVNGVSHEQQQSKSFENLIDWNQPILWQVSRLGSKYNNWVHTPVDKPLRLFKSELFEYLSKTPWFIIPIVWIPVVLLTSFRSLRFFKEVTPEKTDSEVLETFFFHFFAGILLWTILEYLLHRFLFHLEPSPKYPMSITFHFLLHGQHHKVPFDPGRLVFPPVPASLLALCFHLLISCVLPVAEAQALFAGTVFGYVCYDLIHYYLHYGKPSLSYFKMLKAYHINHHFEDNNKGYGISSPLWDLPFGTQPDLNTKKD
ncbi:dihydroceramide fatty acyl 2-hydroxylase FAH2-like isoform X1 [Anneissia japonica]|nr:dihydroceramide fatty acyl 2-hydroxylase FAH2-like isoform X1 [Anneissia japonica]XP_033114069.1 dihydroceramide fatty acyl 2-hydroxylase FAH2-like isoform X1 [Anneissia japonica]